MAKLSAGIRVNIKKLPIDLKKLIVNEGNLRSLGLHLQAHVREEIYTSKWSSPKAAHSVARSIHFELGTDYVILYTTKPYIEYHNDGVKKQQMTWLTKAKKPIPLRRNGATIFRWATPASMARGSWWHPGIVPKKFVERGMAKGRISAALTAQRKSQNNKS